MRSYDQLEDIEDYEEVPSVSITEDEDINSIEPEMIKV